MKQQKPSLAQAEKMRPRGGWAGVKFVITPANLYVPEDHDRKGEPYSRFQPPGKPQGSRGWEVGDIFSLSEKELEGAPVEQWLTTGRVVIYKEPAAKPKAVGAGKD